MTSYVSREEFDRMSGRLAQIEKRYGGQSAVSTVVTVTSEVGEIRVKEIVQQNVDKALVQMRRGGFSTMQNRHDSRRG
jgi:hypothetical protein